MTYKQIWEQLEYSILHRLDIMSDEAETELGECLRMQRIDALERTLKQMKELEKEITKLRIVK